MGSDARRADPPAGPERSRTGTVADRAAPVAVELPPTLALRSRKGDATLSFFSVVATVETPLDVSLQNPRLELFFPADAATEAWLRRV